MGDLLKYECFDKVLKLKNIWINIQIKSRHNRNLISAIKTDFLLLTVYKIFGQVFANIFIT